MGRSDLSSLLEECIRELQAGSNPEEILARYPKYARQLRPLLETAAWTKKVGASVIIPDDAQANSRKAFTSRQSTRQTRAAFRRFNPRLAFSIAAIILILVLGFFGTRIASAQALPGDTLYPVKIAWEQVQISLTSGTAERLHLEQTFDMQRVAEVNKLINLGRTSSVTFTGVLAGSNNAWNVAGIDLNVDDQQAGTLPDLENTVVQVSGETEGKSVKVNDIEPHLVTLNGQIQRINPENMQVDGINVTLDKNTEVDGELSVNQQVQITARQQVDGELVAIMVNGKASVLSTPTSKSSPTDGQKPGNQKSGAPVTTPQPTEQENSPTPTSGIQPMMTDPTTVSTPVPGNEPEKGPGNSGTVPTPTPTNSDQSGHGGEYQPMPTPTPAPSSESGQPAATRSPTED